MKIFIISALIIFCGLNNRPLFAQNYFFDSTYIVASSSNYDYKNPYFDASNYYFNADSWLVYERHSSITSSQVIARNADFDGYNTETIITNNQDSLNLNPVYSGNMLVWQSNQRGNWDIYYSLLTGNVWSQPVLLDSSDSDETQPFVINNGLFISIENRYYFVVYKKNNAVWFKRYKTSTGVWDKDTIVTPGISEECVNPLISTGNTNQFGVSYLRLYPGIKRINITLFSINPSTGIMTWQEPFEVYQPNNQNNLTISYSWGDFLTYDYDTLGTINAVGFQVPNYNSKAVFTKNIPGRHSSGKASLMGLITDNLGFYFSVFSCITKNHDSTLMTFINSPSSFNNKPYFKRIYIGDSSIVSRHDISPPLFNISGNIYRIRGVWEQDINGRTALVESYMTDMVGNAGADYGTVNNYFLEQNYPNPFNPETNIRFGIPSDNQVVLKIYDINGKEVETLVNAKLTAGNYSIVFNGSGLSSGVYYCKIISGNFSDVKKIMLVK
jgi:hypothetical protein